MTQEPHTPGPMSKPGQRPVVTLDLDGVLCRPPLGINPGRGRSKRRDKAGTKSLLWLSERWRYAGRGPMPGAKEGFLALSQRFDCHVLSARGEAARKPTEAWLQRHLGVVPDLSLRPDWHETPAQFKVRRVRELGAIAHFEDDPHTAAWLAERLPAVFLVDWWRNRWLDDPRVHRIRRIAEALPLLEALPEAAVTSA